MTLYWSLSDPKEVLKRWEEVSQACYSAITLDPIPFVTQTIKTIMGDKYWVINVYKSLKMIGIKEFPHSMLEKYEKWQPKFSSNSAISTEQHITTFYQAIGRHGIPNEDKNAIMKLFALSLEENVKTWFNGLLDYGIIDWNDFHNDFTKRWSIRKDARLMFTQLHEMKKDSDIVKDFYEKFHKLIRDFPPNLKPNYVVILLHYTNAFEWKFGLL